MTKKKKRLPTFVASPQIPGAGGVLDRGNAGKSALAIFFQRKKKKTNRKKNRTPPWNAGGWKSLLQVCAPRQEWDAKTSSIPVHHTLEKDGKPKKCDALGRERVRNPLSRARSSRACPRFKKRIFSLEKKKKKTAKKAN